MKGSSNRHSNPMFEALSELPLLRGASMALLSEVCGQLKIRFSKAAAGEGIRSAGEECDGLVFVLSGSVRIEQNAEDFSIAQTLDAPQVISPEYLFGLSTSFPCTVTALSSVGYMEISKEDYRRMLSMDPVFLFNYLNIISAQAQRAKTGLFAIARGTNATERVSCWIEALTCPGARDIELRGNGREPHQIFGISTVSMRSAAEKLGAQLDGNTLKFTSR